MPKTKILNSDIQEMISGVKIAFPKYTTQVMNLANSNSQATRPKNVGQLSDLIQEFKGNKISEWRSFYTEKHPNAIKEAAKKVYDMCVLMGMDKNIKPELTEMWVDDLIINKTFIGLKFQEAILCKIAKIKETTYTLATPEDESIGVDGAIGDVKISVKPISYKSKILSEDIKVPIIYYTKKKDGISIEWDF
jgi:hypothetical protein